MCEAPAKEPPYTVEVDEEGKYGFTLVARSGVGLCKRRPATGDEPQVWVIVDHTAPEVQLLETTPHQSSHSVDLSIHWSAGDKNFGPQPIALYYAEREDGPWQLVATKLPNTGHYVWSTPSSIPGQVFVRVEATDLAGNVSQAQSKAPIVLDRATPTAAILGIEAGR